VNEEKICGGASSHYNNSQKETKVGILNSYLERNNCNAMIKREEKRKEKETFLTC